MELCVAASSIKCLDGSGLTIHSSRSRFAARLNSGVRPHMKRLSVLAVLLLCACTSAEVPNKAIRVTAADSYFCVPAERIIEAPSWVPRGGTLKDEGFAVTGCYWEHQRNHSSSCNELKSVGSFGVGAETAHAFTNLSSIPEDAFYRTIVGEPDTQLVQLPGAGRVALSNKRLSWLPFYWKASSSSVTESSVLAAGDELLFTCERKDEAYLCGRTFSADGLSINYHFGTDDPVAFDVATQDAEILSFLEGLKCNAV